MRYKKFLKSGKSLEKAIQELIFSVENKLFGDVNNSKFRNN